MGKCVAECGNACLLSWTRRDIHLCVLPKTKGMRLHSHKCMQRKVSSR